MAEIKTCFVIGPIGDEDSPERIHADFLLHAVIEPVFKESFSSWLVERADTIPAPGMVSSQIITRLYDADLVIADLSFHNANAFYEMSIRHTAAKPIIHMIRKGEKIPFDVIPHRAIQFALNRYGDQAMAKEQVRMAVTEAIKEGFEADNPITHARGRAELAQTSGPMKVVMDELATLRARLDSVETTAELAHLVANRAAGSPPMVFPKFIDVMHNALGGAGGGTVIMPAEPGLFRLAAMGTNENPPPQPQPEPKKE